MRGVRFGLLVWVVCSAGVLAHAEELRVPEAGRRHWRIGGHRSAIMTQ